MIAQANPNGGITQTGSAHATAVRDAREAKLDDWTRQEAKRVSMLKREDVAVPDQDMPADKAFAFKARQRVIRRQIDQGLQDGARKTHMTIGAFAGEVYGRLKRDYPELVDHLKWFGRSYKIDG